MLKLFIPQKDIRTQGLAVILASNPRNPTGQVSRRPIIDIPVLIYNLLRSSGE